MSKTITNPFADYGYISQDGYTGYKKQLQNQGMETDFYVDFGKGFVPGSPEPVSHYLTFTANENNSSVAFVYYGIGTLEDIGLNVEYSTDNGDTWNAYTVATDENEAQVIELNQGESVKFRGVNENLAYNRGGKKGYQNTNFIIEGSVSASGDVTSLLNNEGGDYEISEHCFQNMFYNCTGLTTAPELPAMTLANSCYQYMFQGCTGLTTAPELPATTLADFCYQSMFDGCTSLTTAPELPATTLANDCYVEMFRNCTSLATAPELLATTLANGCYSGMFQNCTSLTTAPELPATALANYCYGYMFSGCTNLNNVTCLATDILFTDCTSNWLSGVAGTGTFTKAASMSSWTTGDSGIPSGWEVEDYEESSNGKSSNKDSDENGSSNNESSGNDDNGGGTVVGKEGSRA